MKPITAIVTPVSEDNDFPGHSAVTAAASVDAALNGVVLHDKFEKAAFSPTSTGTVVTARAAKIEDPLIPTLNSDTTFVPLQPSYSDLEEEEDDDENLQAAETIRRFSEHNTRFNDDATEQDGEVLEAASILCMLSNAKTDEGDIRKTMDMMSMSRKFEISQADEDESSSSYYAYEQELEDPLPALPPPKFSNLRHPDRLATEDDAMEVNRLHQYVRSDLLEIFTVPQVDDQGDDESDDDDANSAPRTKTESYDRVTRNSHHRGSVSSLAANATATTIRHYPGRVGLRCIHCANVRPSTHHATKSSFYPLRLHNIYREVCAWQRIHFKNCPYVPRGVRERYDWLKNIDTSRGKVRYWEVSARKIGLQNNPNREDGIVFSNTVW
ncbi:hypothetical protein HJC23_002317 [Cyclotella cryptica]|uniref:Uncharacterized protein n=1 Tax=Cyclotella cryptica TaxID=29204 RepID=A0ABD3QKJ9_9STRA|eukprot:CCRYP_004396-RA/>CCRYP_004396-RA protein AED:0.02 eAED:0.02 QI:122/1/1/1/1/1/2/859/382